MKEEWLDYKNIDVVYNTKKALKNFNLRLYTGENTVIIGPNGSGKSTFIRTITKLKYPIYKKDSYIKFYGSRNNNIWDLRSKISFVLTDLDERIQNDITIDDMILSGSQSTFGIIDKAKLTNKDLILLEEIKSKFDLYNIEKYYCDLSDGQKRKVLIARSIFNKPKVLLLDEPTCRLDLKSHFELLKLLNDLCAKDLTLVYVTHRVENIIKNVQRVILFKDGAVYADGKPEEVINSESISLLYNYPLNVKYDNRYWIVSPKLS